jgi:hypothetical protein
MTTTNGTKYTFVCDPDECDSLVELTTVDGFGFPKGVVENTCPCGRKMSYIGATILSSQTTTKGNQMLDNLENTVPFGATVSDAYNPNLLVTYKKIDNDEVSYLTEKVTDIEWALDQSRRNYKNLTEKQNSWYTKESQLRTLLEEVYEDSDDQESLARIAEIFDIPLTKEIEYTAWVRVDLTVEVELGGDVDAIEDFISQNLTVDSYDGLIQVNGYDVDRVEEGAY